MFEEMEPKKKNSKMLTLLAVFVLLVTVVGVSVAAYTWTFTGGTNQIGTGNIAMSLLESTDVIDIQNALPQSDTAGRNQSDYFDFAVTTSASGAPGNITYSISVTKVAADTGYTLLQDNQVKIYMTTFTGSGNDITETQVVAAKKVSEVITSGDTGVLTFDSGKTSYLTHTHTTTGQQQTTKYRLRMWVSSDTDASSWTSATKLQYKLKVSVSGSLVAA